MSTDSATGADRSDPEQMITLTAEDDGWVARDEETGIASQGETREEALEMLDDAVALYKGEAGHEPTEEELRDLGVNPANNESGSLEDSDIFE